MKPQLGFSFFVWLFVVVYVSKKNKKLNGCGWVASSQSDFFSDFLIFFNLTRPLSYCLLHMNVSWYISMIYFAIFVYRVDLPVPMSTISGLS